MKLTYKYLTSILPLALAMSLAHATSYQNMYLAYYSPNDVAAMVNYAKAQQLGGLIVWEFKGDTTYGSSNSLLSTAVNSYQPSTKNQPTIMGYWSDWSVYTAQAIPGQPYPVPGSHNSAGNTVSNTDFSQKLAGMNVVAYAFLEAQSKTYTYYDAASGQSVTKINPNYQQDGGTLFFFDPWSDLLPLGSDDSFCNDASNSVCWYVDNMQGKDPKQSAQMGNFEAFAQLKHQSTSNPLGPLKKIISVGGYAHDATFEDSFDNATHIANFVNSAASIIDHYQLDGIDLDYENPSMTHQQSDQFYSLVSALRKKLGNDKTIDITMLANPAYLQGSEASGTIGFDPNTNALGSIAKLADHINLMTYDFHGAFDYDPGKGRTGFLTNLYMPTDAPSGYDAKFSVNTSVQAALQAGVPAQKLSVGIPAYGRSLANIPSDNGGLFQIIPSTASIPRGNLDAANCATAITPLGGNSCSGSFSYRYIIANMLSKGFTASARTDAPNNIDNGTTAFASSWQAPVSTSYQLVASNDDSAGLGITLTIKNSDHQLTTDYIAPGTSKIYTGKTAVSTIAISGQSDLTVEWATYNKTGTCPNTFNFDKNYTVAVHVSADGTASCSIQPTST